jgi:hypothetical protein
VSYDGKTWNYTGTSVPSHGGFTLSRPRSTGTAAANPSTWGVRSWRLEAIKLIITAERRKHIQVGHVTKSVELGANKFKGARKDAEKLIERVVAGPRQPDSTG